MSKGQTKDLCMALPWRHHGNTMVPIWHHYGISMPPLWHHGIASGLVCLKLSTQVQKTTKYHLHHNHHHFIETLKGIVTSSHSNPLVFQISAGGYQVDTRWIPCGYLVDTRWIPASARDSISLDLRLHQLDMIGRHLLISWSCYHWSDNICFWRRASVICNL